MLIFFTRELCKSYDNKPYITFRAKSISTTRIVPYHTFTMSPVAVSDRRSHSIACIPADGIGPEVISAGVEVLKTLASADGTFDMTFEDYDWSSETYKQTGKYIPDGGLDSLKKHDAILFGAVGAPGKLS